MVNSAYKAGRSLIRDFNEVEKLQVSAKGPGDFVSRADLRSEEILHGELTRGRSNYGWFAEESEPIPGKDPTRRWIVDPLDGTTNFLHGLPYWAISIALEHKRDIVAGVIYNPVLHELFVAEKGNGAWLNDNRIRVSGRSDTTTMLFATAFPATGRPGWNTASTEMSRVLPTCAGIRAWGCAALNLAYVAAGRLDGFWESGLNPWDMAAGLILVAEAGGLASSIHHNGEPIRDGTVLAATESAYDHLAPLVMRPKR